MRYLGACAAAVLAISAGSTASNAASFAYSVDRVDITGNVSGGFVDDFADGVLAPWAVSFGTAAESGGFLTLSDPGAVQTLGLALFREDSAAFLSSVLHDGNGDFTYRATWQAVAPSLDHSFGIDTISQRADGFWEQIVIVLTDLSPSGASPFGLPTGPQLVQLTGVREDSPGGPGDFVSTLLESFPIASAVTGDVVFEILFDDTTNTLSTRASLDGGGSFEPSAFSSFTFTPGGPSFINPGVIATATFVPEPAMSTLILAGLVGGLAIQKRRSRTPKGRASRLAR